MVQKFMIKLRIGYFFNYRFRFTLVYFTYYIFNFKIKQKDNKYTNSSQILMFNKMKN